ncbi:phage baseplate protein [Ruegeria sp.]|uniref:phage baseplate protein n=1 Tax=Ruegeria sp. TaxID=1879320 RepID=UPI003B00E95D
MSKQLLIGAASAILATTLIGFVTLIANWFTEGGVAKLIGALPANAVVAFDVPNGCPHGWSVFQQAQSRVLIGVGPGQVSSGNKLSSYNYREEGGYERVTLDKSNLPKHQHGYNDIYWSEVGGRSSALTNALGNKGDSDRDNSGHEIRRQTAETGEGNPVDTMPPYIALYFCKKN